MAKKETKKLGTLDILKKCKEFIDNNTSIEEQNKYFDKNIIIKKYIPVEEKFENANIIKICLMSRYDMLTWGVTTDNTGYVDYSNFYKEYELIKVLTIFPCYTNMSDLFFDTGFSDCEKYDILFASGLFEYVYDKTRKDYDSFSTIVDNYVEAKNILLVSELKSLTANLPTQEKINDFITTLNDLSAQGDTISSLAEIIDFNNPKVAEIADIIDKEAIKDANDKMKK